MTDPIRAALERLVATADELAADGFVVLPEDFAAARTALAAAPPDGLVAPLKERPDFIAGYSVFVLNDSPPIGQSFSDRAVLDNSDGLAVSEGPVAVADAGPSDQELIHTYTKTVAATVDAHPCAFNPEDVQAAQIAGLRAVLTRWGRPAPAPTREGLKPVPVSDPPKPEDCDAEGRCWWFVPASVLRNVVCPYWCLAPAESPRSWFTHWLPAHALPIPTTSPAGQEGA